MITTLSIVLFSIFISLSLIHFYWLFGGKWGIEKVIPTKENKVNTSAIPPFATFIVAMGLLLFGLIYLSRIELFGAQVSKWVPEFLYWFIPSIFLMRAIGDFNYVGLFKKIKHTEFAKSDTKWFVPLCLIISVLGTLIQLMRIGG